MTQTTVKTKATTNNTTETAASGLFAMRPAIIQAHNSNNKAAITFDDCEDLKITRQTYDQWVAYMKNLREAASNYMDVSGKKSSTDKQIQTAAGKLFSAWRDVLKNAEGPKFSKNWFVRKSDSAWLLACVKRNVNTTKGAQYGHKTETNFRREVERLIGCRMLSNSILSDKESEAIVTYDKAVATEKRLKKLLEEGDKETPSLLNQRDNLEKKVEDMTTFFNTFMSKEDKEYDEKLEKALYPYKNALKDLKNQIKSTRKGIDKAVDTQKAYKTDYDTALAKVETIEA